MGPRYTRHDSAPPAPCQADRLATQVPVLPRSHSNVGTPFMRVSLSDVCLLLSVDSITYSSANSSSNRTWSRGNSRPSSRSVSRTIYKGCRSHILQRGIDPHVDDPDYCHVSARSADDNLYRSRCFRTTPKYRSGMRIGPPSQRWSDIAIESGNVYSTFIENWNVGNAYSPGDCRALSLWFWSTTGGISK